MAFGDTSGDGLAFLVSPEVDVCSVQSRVFQNHQEATASRLAQQLLFRWQSRTLAVVQTQLGAEDESSANELCLWQMKQFLAGLPQRVCDGMILCGDWSVPVSHCVVDAVEKAGFVDGLAHVRHPTCWVGKHPLAIDHIFHSPSLHTRPMVLAEFQSAERYPNEAHGSDHLPVGIELLAEK